MAYEDIKAQVKEQFNEDITTKLDAVGRLIVEKIRTMLETQIGHKTGLSNEIVYEVDAVEKSLIIYANSDILAYLEYGTRPHTIKPKHKKALAFRSETGEQVVVKEVRHPGFEAKPYFYEAIFLSLDDAMRILSS